jgi:hypothetical protein
MSDARFEDGGEKPLRLKAETVDDLGVISALIQDAVAQTSDISWLRKHRRFAVLLNRFRWEDAGVAEQQARAFERVQAVLQVEDVLKVTASGIDPRDKSLVLSVLSVGFAAGEDGAGVLTLTFAGDGEVAVEVECLNVTLLDASRPYVARAQAAPTHE